jgi:hypothetical protein
MDRDGVEVDILYASHLRHIYGLSTKDEPFFRPSLSPITTG